MTESMKAAIGETDRRRAIQERYNAEQRDRAATIVKGIRDINDRLRVGGRGDGAVRGAKRGPGDLTGAVEGQVEQLVARMEAEMRAAARELEFERAAALRDEIQQIRLRVLEEDASVIVARAAEAAGRRGAAAGQRPARAGPARAARARRSPGARRRDARRRRSR